MSPGYQRYLENTVLSARERDVFFFFFMFYFNGSTLKELVVRCIVHHGNEVWGCVGPGILYFFSLIPAISKGGKEAVGAQGQPEGLCLLFPSHLCG